MRDLSKLLSGLKNKLYKDEITKSSIVEAIFESTRIRLKEEDVSLRNGNLEVKAGAALRNEIKLKELEITHKLRDLYKVNISRIYFT